MIETVDDLQIGIAEFEARGYRLDMIFPADSPREAILSRGDLLSDSTGQQTQDNRNIRLVCRKNGKSNAASAIDSDWHVGRAGMEYRDLIPDRLNGKLIASHIRIVEGGAVADNVHYHKIAFQVIYCLMGAIRVVYEDQGEPFWLRAGDCVLQPPEIRHRVLEAEAGSEVVEITSPAEHETWLDHEMELPTEISNGGKLFNGQRFVRHAADGSAANWDGSGQICVRNTGIKEASIGLVDVKAVTLAPSYTLSDEGHGKSIETVDSEASKETIIADGKHALGQDPRSMVFFFVQSGEVSIMVTGRPLQAILKNECVLIPTAAEFSIKYRNNVEFLCVSFPES